MKLALLKQAPQKNHKADLFSCVMHMPITK